MLITVSSSGSFKNIEAFLNKMIKGKIYDGLESLAKEGVAALRAATPMASGATAEGWGYEISETKGTYTITWTNSHVIDGAPIAILLQYGHATGTGGYVRGRDYINPAIKPIFDKIADKAWKVVKSA